MQVIDRAFVRGLMPARDQGGHKGTFGKVYLLGGSVGYTGAPVLCAGGAVHSGCGLVFLGVPETVWPIAAARCLCAMPHPLAEQDGRLSAAAETEIRHRAAVCDAVAVGCGLGRSEGSDVLVRALLTLEKPLVLDADGINALAGHIDTLSCRRGCVTVLTPHDGELARIGGDMTAPRLKDTNIDILIATDCISEGQNLQDCDMMVNYDIHWNPVRIIQRFGRIDRIGSTNKRIQLVNYWPDVDLDKYLKLKDRVEARMKVAVMASTGDDDYINPDEKGDLEYRERQLRQMQDEVLDLEDVDGGVSITDLGLNEFRMDLVGYHRDNPDIERTPTGINAVVEGNEPGILFVLRNTSKDVKAVGRNPIHPYYLVHVGDDGRILHGHLNAKDCLDVMRKLCKGKDTYDPRLCRAYNRFTHDGKDMRHASDLLREAVRSIMDQDDATAADSFFTGSMGNFLDENVKGLDDFELVCFLVIRPATGGKS